MQQQPPAELAPGMRPEDDFVQQHQQQQQQQAPPMSPEPGYGAGTQYQQQQPGVGAQYQQQGGEAPATSSMKPDPNQGGKSPSFLEKSTKFMKSNKTATAVFAVSLLACMFALGIAIPIAIDAGKSDGGDGGVDNGTTPQPDGASMLETITQRGTVRCGVIDSPGWSTPDPSTGVRSGFSVDLVSIVYKGGNSLLSSMRLTLF